MPCTVPSFTAYFKTLGIRDSKVEFTYMYGPQIHTLNDKIATTKKLKMFIMKNQLFLGIFSIDTRSAYLKVRNEN